MENKKKGTIINKRNVDTSVFSIVSCDCSVNQTNFALSPAIFAEDLECTNVQHFYIELNVVTASGE